MEQMQNNPGQSLIKKLGLVFSVLVFLLPVFFVPAVGVNIYVTKIALLATGLVAIFAIFLSSVLSSGTIEMPKAKYLLPLALLVLVALISSALSGSITSSIVGSVFDIGSSGLIVILVFSLFITVLAIRSIGMVSKIISAFVYSTLALAAYTILGAFGFSLLPNSLASKMPVFISGGPVDNAIIFGMVVILSLCALNMTVVSKKMKIILSLLLAYSIIFIGATNFIPVIVILGVISLIFFVYILSWSAGKGSQGNSLESEKVEGQSQFSENSQESSASHKISLSSLVVLIAFVVLLLGGSNISGYLSRAMKIQTVEIRPNFETTMDLAVSAWKQNFVLGIGPNRFVNFWSIHKPVEINQTQFWDTDFYSSSGFVPTMAITTGLLGLLSLLAFVGLYVSSGVKAIFAQAESRSRYFATASFLVSLYLWVTLFLYTPSLAVLALTFIFTGLFTATLVPQGIVGRWKINIFSNPKTKFLSALSIVVLIITSVAGGYFVWERAIAATVFERGVGNYQRTGNIQAAKESVARSITMAPNDVYWRGLAEISLVDFGRVLGGITNQSQFTDAIRNEAQILIANSIEAAKKATENDPANFRNWFALGRVYEVLASNQIQGALENSRSAYAEAQRLSPNNPSVPLALARLEALSGNVAGARENIVKSLNLKNNYTDAYFILAQLEVATNNIPGAIRSVEAATIIDPTNSGLYFQLGLLKYNQKDFAGAAQAFKRAVDLVPDYANAKYFLGLSYYQIGSKEEALKHFEDLRVTNPENQEVATILSNLKAGKAPFAEIKPPADNKPEKRKEPPIGE